MPMATYDRRKPKILLQNLQLFINCWKPKEPGFVQYFNTLYASRAGYNIVIVHNNFTVTIDMAFTEKWALAFRHFDHRNTDTNNFVERLIYTCIYMYSI